MEGKKRVSIKYQYYQLCTFDGDSYTEDLYDLVEWIGRVGLLPLEDTVHEVEGIEGRLEKVEPVYNNMFYSMNFMRLDVISNTYVIKKDEAARHIDLDENEYIGKNTAVLYDPKYSIAMIQCNRGSYGSLSLQQYINSFNEDGKLCYFRPIYNNLDIEKLQEHSTLKMDVRFSNVRQFKPKSRFFERVMASFEELECYGAHIECTLGYAKEAELSKETVYAAVRDIKDPQNEGAISSARLKLSTDQESNIVDLFENVFDDCISFNIPPRKELDFNTMTEAMLKQYYEKGSRNKLYRILEK